MPRRTAFGVSVSGLSAFGLSAFGLSAFGLPAALAVPVAVPSREYAAAVAPAAWRRVRRDGPVPWVSDA
ncbi:hypothetical protein [Streptomyces europaeiscabiei]|uniref:hypothetical protein n=1 Tax=Streptomyces europaeiscabiei TaxID=146819 RepID=UPI0029A73E53|nr:hypothetical protein [Streptomyces europaeiscabiei]MDX3859785.1 hypothetical protein [Streptomyces europaeiscabiei]MDX3876470.1 hypothetical protein [Streptomyces europaeiscabiei]